jgi:hypothetical protein
MRKITKKIANAFHNQQRLTVSNTTTDGSAVWLHGNKIIERRQDGIWFTLAGWNTVTTRERLTGILPDVRISSRKGDALLYVGNRSEYIEDHKWINLNQFSQGA